MTYQAFNILLKTADEPLLRKALSRAQEILTDEQRFYILRTIKAGRDAEAESIPELLPHLHIFVQRLKAGYFYREFALDKRIPLDYSMIEAAAYDTQSKALYLQFVHTGYVYAYDEAPPATCKGLIKATSVGRFVPELLHRFTKCVADAISAGKKTKT